MIAAPGLTPGAATGPPTIWRGGHGDQDRGHRRRQHLHARAGRGHRPAPRACCPSTSSSLHDIDPDRLEIVGGLAERILRQLGFTGRFAATTDRDDAPSTTPRSCSCSCASAAWRRACATRPSRLKYGCIGQETTGAGRLRQGAAHRARRARHRRRHAAPRRARRLAARLHQPVRARHAGAARPRPPRHRPVQRADRLPARLRQAPRRAARARAARARRPQPPLVGAQGAGRRRRPPAGADRRATPTSSPHEVETAGRAHPRAARHPLVLPALLLLHLAGARER